MHMRMHVCIGIRIDLHMDVPQLSISQQSMYTYTGVCGTHVRTCLYRRVYRHVYRHVYGHVYLHEHLHTSSLRISSISVLHLFTLKSMALCRLYIVDGAVQHAGAA